MSDRLPKCHCGASITPDATGKFACAHWDTYAKGDVPIKPQSPQGA